MRVNAFTQDISALIGRVLISSIFLFSSMSKIMHFTANVAYMASKGVPFTEVLLVMALIVELVGALMILLGWHTRAGAFVLVLFVIVVTMVFHNFWTYPPAESATQMAQFLKNVAIIGGMFYIIAYGAGRFSIDRKRLFAHNLK